MKSPARNLRKLFAAFTLIELLTVIAIIAILMGLLFPALGAVREAARKAQAKNDETEIVTAVKAYYTEYGKYPINSAVNSGTMDALYSSGTMPFALSGTAQIMGNNSALIDVLRYNTGGTNATIVSSTNSTSLNTRQIAFLDVPAVKNSALPASGVVVNTGTANIGCWFDPWGSQYNILIDANYDNTVGNPYQDNPGGTPLTTGVIVWSYGKNGQLGGGAAIGGYFTKENGSPGYYYSTPSNSTTATSGDVISWQ